MSFSVTRCLDFCYGHRLLDYQGKCRYLHGHNAQVEIEITSSDLDNRGMVVDFADIKEKLKPWIDEALDHKMLLRRDDPLAPILEAQGESFVALDHNPTAENIARLIFRKARALGLPVTKVTLWETPNSFAVYAE